MTALEQSSDPFGLRSFGVDDVSGRPGVKWAGVDGRLAGWIADMDFPIAPAIVERLQRRVAVDVGYPAWDDAVASPLPRRFAERMAAQFDWCPRDDRLHELCDVLQGVELALHHLSAPGDGVVLHTPAYPPFLRSIAHNRRQLVEVPATRTADGFVWDYDELEERLTASAGGPGAPRLWILCHPHNPTGRVFDLVELTRIAEIAERHDLIVISDEIHAELVHPPAQHLPFESLGRDVAARTVTVTSPSKAFNLAGLRWAILHAGHTPLEAVIASLPVHYLGAPNLLAVEAIDAAWSDGEDWLADVRAVLDENRHRLGALLDVMIPEASYHVPQATYLAWIDFSAVGLGDDPAAAFRRRGVELAGGLNFGPLGAGCARLNFATSPAVLEAIVGALVAR